MTNKLKDIALFFWNNFKAIALFILLGAGLILGVYVASKYAGSRQYKPAIPAGSKIDYVIYTKYVDKPIYITKLEAKLDTIYVDAINDTTNDAVIVAEADTLLLADSSRIGITYYFPPRNYFDVKANIKERVITKELTIEKPYEPSFFDRFNVVIYGGLGYDFLQKIPTLSVGLGLGFDIKKVF